MMRQRFDAHLLRFPCPRCHSPIREPAGSFRKPYHCYGCGVRLNIPMLADLERQAYLFGDDPYELVAWQVIVETAARRKWGPGYDEPMFLTFTVEAVE